MQKKTYYWLVIGLKIKFSVVDINKNQILSQIDVGNSPAGIFLSDDESYLLQLKEKTIVTVIDFLTQKKIKDINVGKAPYGVFSDKKLIYYLLQMFNQILLQ